MIKWWFILLFNPLRYVKLGKLFIRLGQSAVSQLHRYDSKVERIIKAERRAYRKRIMLGEDSTHVCIEFYQHIVKRFSVDPDKIINQIVEELSENMVVIHRLELRTCAETCLIMVNFGELELWSAEIALRTFAAKLTKAKPK